MSDPGGHRAHQMNRALVGVARHIGRGDTVPAANVTRRKGVVTASSTGPARVTVTLGGGMTSLTVPYLKSYIPTVGDVVLVLATSDGDAWVEGAFA